MDIPQVPVNGDPLSNEGFPNGDATGQTVASTTQAQTISADEIALYDRQIRLWGVQAQEKLRTANILLIGFKALGNEIAKNLVLAGVGSLTINDDQLVSEDDLGAQFFISEQHIGMNRAQAALPQIQRLNPRVAIQIDATPILLKDPSYFATFSIIIATDLPLSLISTLNTSCRLNNRPFYAAGAHGLYGFIFADLLIHDFIIEREKSNIPTVHKAESATRSIIASSTKRGSNGKLVEIVTKREMYSPIILANSSPIPASHLSSRRRKLQITPLLTCFKALWEFQSISNTIPAHTHADIELFTTLATEKHKELQLPPEALRSEFLRSFLQNLGSELAPVTAILGGQLAQDVINVIGHREQPIQNFLFFDGEEFKGPVYALHPDFPPLE